MKKSMMLAFALTGLCLICMENSAQAVIVRGGYGGRWYHPYYRGYGYGRYGYGGYGYGGGTVAEGYGMGMSQVIRAQGQYNKDAAQAQLTREEARTKNIENNKKAADTYWAMRERHDQYKDQQRQQKKARAEANRAKLEETESAPRYRGLGPDDFDSVTGKINWPELLMQPRYDEYRSKLDDLFEHRTLTGGAAGEANSDAIEDTANAMREALKDQIKDLPADDYIAARKFIDGLAFEGRS